MITGRGWSHGRLSILTKFCPIAPQRRHHHRTSPSIGSGVCQQKYTVLRCANTHCAVHLAFCFQVPLPPIADQLNISLRGGLVCIPKSDRAKHSCHDFADGLVCRVLVGCKSSIRRFEEENLLRSTGCHIWLSVTLEFTYFRALTPAWPSIFDQEGICFLTI